MGPFGSVWVRFGSVSGRFGVLGGVGVGSEKGASVREKNTTKQGSAGRCAGGKALSSILQVKVPCQHLCHQSPPKTGRKIGASQHMLKSVKNGFRRFSTFFDVSPLCDD